jgi:hypothetical protein
MSDDAATRDWEDEKPDDDRELETFDGPPGEGGELTDTETDERIPSDADQEPLMPEESSGGVPEGDLLDDVIDDAAEALLGPMEDFAPPGDFPQNWTLLFCCVGFFVGAVFLPIEGDVLDLYAKDSIAGGFLAVLAAYGVLASYANIYHRKMIMWPVLFAMFDGFYIAIRRLIQLLNGLPDGASPHQAIRAAGPGLYVILVCSLLVLWTLFQGVRAGAKKEKARKEAAKAGRKSRTGA